jgi:DNA-binding response OmpR family regulator
MAQSQGTAGKRLALLVEDERAIRELVTLHLGIGGFDVTVADGARTLALARTTHYDSRFST